SISKVTLLLLRFPDHSVRGRTRASFTAPLASFNPPQGITCLLCILPRSLRQFLPDFIQPVPAKFLRRVPPDAAAPFKIIFRQPLCAKAPDNFSRFATVRTHRTLELRQLLRIREAPFLAYLPRQRFRPKIIQA